MSQRRKILFIIPYPLGEAPSQRFRFEQYFSALESNDFLVQTQTFLTASNWRVFYIKGKILKKVAVLLYGFLRRIVGLIDVTSADFIFIHREASPIGPPVVEWLIARVLGKKIIYDFDDSIWLTDNMHESWLRKTAKWRGKVSTICRLSYRVSCGNEYLSEYARKFTSNVLVNPTTIDTTSHFSKKELVKTKSNKVVIGWTGSHSTLKYLQQLESVLNEIEKLCPEVEFLIIADRAPELNLKRAKFLKWEKHSEISQLINIDIGIMPLPNDEWSQGKCGFKILQYMALSIPSVSSPVGVNCKIIEHGRNGLLCYTHNDWIVNLQLLVKSISLRQELGESGRRTVTEIYSTASNTPNFLSLFK